MQHSVQPPSLPPDSDDLYIPDQHLRVGQMARLVWSVMRLSSTTIDFAWCTVCRKWYRYRSDFNESYIKTLFRHCKQQHIVGNDGTLKPVSTSSTSHQPQANVAGQSAAASAFSNTIGGAASKAPSPVGLTPAALQQLARTSPEAPMLAQAQAQVFSSGTQRAGQSGLGNGGLSLQASTSMANGPSGGAPSVPISQALLNGTVHNQKMHKQILQRYQAALQQNAVQRVLGTGSDAASKLSSQQQAILRAQQASAGQALHTPRRVHEQPQPSATRADGHTMQNRSAQQASINAAGQRRSHVGDVIRPVGTSPKAPLPVPNAEGDGLPGVPAASPRVAGRETKSVNGLAIGTRLALGGSDAATRSTSLPTGQSSRLGPSRVIEKSARANGKNMRRPVKQGKRCEITRPVRAVAERTQRLMFARTNLFFTEATFQVPNTVDEAFDIMKRGIFDLDKDNPSTSDLYYISWSHTQLFAAQMAALGFRFMSCNLKRKVGLKEPPPVEGWLRLERFPSSPRVQASKDTSSAGSRPNPSTNGQGTATISSTVAKIKTSPSARAAQDQGRPRTSSGAPPMTDNSTAGQSSAPAASTRPAAPSAAYREHPVSNGAENNKRQAMTAGNADGSRQQVAESSEASGTVSGSRRVSGPEDAPEQSSAPASTAAAPSRKDSMPVIDLT